MISHHTGACEVPISRGWVIGATDDQAAFTGISCMRLIL